LWIGEIVGCQTAGVEKIVEKILEKRRRSIAVKSFWTRYTNQALPQTNKRATRVWHRSGSEAKPDTFDKLKQKAG
jgi:hypothetical protein